MRALFKLFLVLLLPTAAGALTLGWLAFSSKPVISNSIALTHEDIARAKAILKRNDPRRIPPGAQRALEITREDLNLAADYVLRKGAPGSHSPRTPSRRTPPCGSSRFRSCRISTFTPGSPRKAGHPRSLNSDSANSMSRRHSPTGCYPASPGPFMAEE